MYRPVWAIFWQLWRRHRWGASFDVAYLLAAALIVALLPAPMRSRVVGFYLAVTGTGVLLHVLTIFSYGLDTELTKKDSGFPQRTFTLPVPTRKLVNCPMLGGLAAVYAVWLWFAMLVLRPCGYPAQLLSPAGVLAVFLAVIQALAWMPFSEGWMRTILTFVVLSLLAVCEFALVVAGVNPEGWRVAAWGAVWLAAYGAAVAGVSRARRGDAVNWPAAQRLVQRIVEWQPERRGGFRSASHAQRWYELRRGALLAPCYVGVLLIMLTPVLFLGRNPSAASRWGLVLVAVFMPPLIFGFFGVTLGKPDPWSRSPISGFLATRPLSCADLVAAKFRAAVTTSFLSCGMVLAFIVVWLAFASNREALIRFCQGVSPVKIVAIVAAGLAGWWALTWKSLAEGFYIGLTGREWVVSAAGIVFGGLFMATLGAGLWLYFHGDYLPAVLAWTPWLLATPLAAKAGLAAWAMWALYRRRLLPTIRLLQGVAAWCAIVVALCGCAIWLTPSEWASPWTLIGSCVLFVPLARLAAAPLALAWNRHR